MLETHLRHHCQRLFIDPVVKFIAKYSNANFVTFLSLLFGVLVLFSTVSHHKLLALMFLLLSGYCDILDGSIARYCGQNSVLGCVFDIVADRLVEFVIILGFFLYEPTRGLLCILILGSILFCITSFLVIGIFSENDGHKSFFYSVGLMERAEAFIFFGAMIIWPHAFTYLATAFIILVSYTAIQHIWKFAVYDKEQQQEN